MPHATLAPRAMLLLLSLGPSVAAFAPPPLLLPSSARRARAPLAPSMVSLPGFGAPKADMAEDPALKTTVVSPLHAPTPGKTVPAVVPRQYGRTVTLTQRVDPRNVRQGKALLRLVVGVGLRDVLVAGCGAAALLGAQVASGGALAVLSPTAVGGIVVLSRYFEHGISFPSLNLRHWFQPEGKVRRRLSDAGAKARELLPEAPMSRPAPQLYARVAATLAMMLSSVQASAADLMGK